MSSLSWLVPVPVLLPLLFAGFALVLFRKHKMQRFLALIALSTTTIASAVLAIAAHTAPQVLDVGNWAAPIGITLVVDRLSGTMLFVSQLVTLAVLIYSTSQFVTDDNPRAPVAVYFPTFLILSAGVANAFLTGDLFNLFVGFEILLAASFVLITLGGTHGRIRAGTVYVVVSLLSSSLFLAGIALTYAATGTVNISQLAQRLPEIDQGTALMIHVILFVAFGIKAAIFPLHAWLPDSYPTAPGPVTAVFAGLMTKIGVYALIRLEVLIFPNNDLSLLLTILGIATMILGILGAVAQDDIKRLLSFVLVSHIGFMLWGLAVMSTVGLAATIYYAAHHILVQTTLFLIAALIERRAGTTSLAKLHSLSRTAPALAVVFFISGINLVGIPPLTGFVGKLGLMRASVEVGTASAWALAIAGLATSFLTLYVFIKWWSLAFWQGADEAPAFLSPAMVRDGAADAIRATRERQIERARRLLVPSMEASQAVAKDSRTESEAGVQGSSRVMYGVVAMLLIAQVGMAVASGPIWSYVSAAARDQMGGVAYIRAVLGEDGRGQGTSVDESADTPVVVPSPNPVAQPLEESEKDADAHDGDEEKPQSGDSAQSGDQEQSGYAGTLSGGGDRQ